MTVDACEPPACPDDRLGRLEEHVHALHDAPQQLAKILKIVSGIEEALAEVLNPPVLQSSAVSQHPLLSRFKKTSTTRSALRSASKTRRSPSKGPSRASSRAATEISPKAILALRDAMGWSEVPWKSSVEAPLDTESPSSSFIDSSPDRCRLSSKDERFDYSSTRAPPSMMSSPNLGRRRGSKNSILASVASNECRRPSVSNPLGRNSLLPTSFISSGDEYSHLDRRHSLISVNAEAFVKVLSKGDGNPSRRPSIVPSAGTTSSRRPSIVHNGGSNEFTSERRNSTVTSCSMYTTEPQPSIMSTNRLSIISLAVPGPGGGSPRSPHEPSTLERRFSVGSDDTDSDISLGEDAEDVDDGGTNPKQGLSGFSNISGAPVVREHRALVTSARPSVASNRSSLRSQLTRIETTCFAEDKLDKREQVASCMFLPDSWPRLAWDVLIITITTFVSFVIPIGLVYFDAGFLSEDPFRILLAFADIFWLIDVAINFRTGIFHIGSVILEPRAVARSYAKSWLPLDILVLCPVVLPQDCAGCSILQITKLLRILKLAPAFFRLQRRFRNAVLTPIKLILGVSLLAHLIACMWRALQWADDMNSDESKEWQTLYVKDMYWVMMTMTTVGYGDIYPTGFRTRIYASVIMILSSLSFGAAITVVSHFTRSLFNDEVEDSISKASRFMRERRIPRKLQDRVVCNLRFHLHQYHLSPNELFAQISPGLQRELSLSFLSEAVLHFPLFNSFHRSCVAELAQAHLWVECFQKDLVSEPAQVVEEVVFVVHGKLVAFCPPEATLDVTLLEAQDLGICAVEGDTSEVHMQAYEDSSSIDVELNAGAWLGEACLLSDEERICAATVISVLQSDLAILKQREYQRIVSRFPQLLKQHQRVQQSLRDGKLTLKDFAYEPKKDQPIAAASGFRNWLLKRTATRKNLQVVPSGNEFGNDEKYQSE